MTTPPPSVHFCGIGGMGMVAAARLAIEAGWVVRGSDGPLYPPASDMVAALGIPVANRYAAENLDWSPQLVLVGNALSRGNPEVEAALSHRMRLVSMAEWLKEHVLRARRPVAICGTHGKTTTTAVTAFVLERCGFAPGFLIGGQPLDFPEPAKLGAPGAPFVIEGDEYDTAFFDKRAKFLHYIPEVAVVTSIEFDHGDIYRDLDEIDLAFSRLLRQIPREGLLLACADNRAADTLRPHLHSRMETYGFGEQADWRGEPLGWRDGLQHLQIAHRNTPWGTVATQLAGKHNLQNILAAVAVAAEFGARPHDVDAALRAFRGVKRRMEIFHEAGGVVFVDDFAHHPTAIRETIAAARGRWPERRLRVLFEPRSNTTVTRRFQHELADSFAGAGEVWLGPIHRAEHIPEEERLDRDELAATLTARGIPAWAPGSAEEIAAAVLHSAAPGDLVLVLSNGAFGGIYAQLKTFGP